MPLDSQDFELMKSLRKAIKESGEQTARKLDEVVASQRAMMELAKKSLANDEKLAEAFNRMAAATENLAEEVRLLREDISPPIDKPKRLPRPQQ